MPMVGNDRRCDADLGARCGEVGVGLCERLIRGLDLRFERIEFGVVEDGPPVAARDGVGGFGRLPAVLPGLVLSLNASGPVSL